MEIIEKQQKNKQNSHDAMKTIETQQKKHYRLTQNYENDFEKQQTKTITNY